MNKGSKFEIAVIMGGKSGEHAASLYTANNVLEYIHKKQYHIRVVFISQKGQWYVERPFYAYLENNLLDNYLIKSLLTDLSDLKYKKSNIVRALAGVDVVFNALHGGDGEDGKIQGLFEYLKIPYTGSGVLACALSMDKLLSRNIFRDEGFFVPKTIAINEINYRQDVGGVFKKLIELLPSGPWVIKPRSLGSSIGVRFVEKSKHLLPVIEETFKIENNVLVEEYLYGIEITCGVFEEKGNTIALMPLEIVRGERRLFDGEMKYNKSLYETIAPPNLSNNIIELVKNFAVAAHRLLGCRMYSRSDFIIVNNKPFILEVNALPGLSPNSLYSRSLKVSNFPFAEFVNRLINEAMDKRRERM